jgi:hypothetical protein
MSTHLKMRIMNTTKFNQFYPMSKNQIKQTKAIKLSIRIHRAELKGNQKMELKL